MAWNGFQIHAGILPVFYFGWVFSQNQKASAYCKSLLTLLSFIRFRSLPPLLPQG